MSSEIDSKKEYLNGYRACIRRANYIGEEIAELRSQKMYPAMNNDGMPHASGVNDLSGYAGKLDELIRQLESEMSTAITKHEEIHNQIQIMQNEVEKEILERRYLLGQNWEKIAVAMNYNYRWTTRLHGRALKNFKLPERSPTKPHSDVI